MIPQIYFLWNPSIAATPGVTVSFYMRAWLMSHKVAKLQMKFAISFQAKD